MVTFPKLFCKSQFQASHDNSDTFSRLSDRMQEMKPGLSRVKAIAGGRCGKFKTKQKNVS